MESDAFQEVDAGYQVTLLVAEDLNKEHIDDVKVSGAITLSWVLAQAWLKAAKWREDNREVSFTMTNLSAGIARIIENSGLGKENQALAFSLSKMAKELWNKGLAQLKYAHKDLESLLLGERNDVKSIIVTVLESITAYLNRNDAEAIDRFLDFCDKIDDSMYQSIDAVLTDHEGRIREKLGSVRELPERIEDFIDNLDENTAKLQVLTHLGKFQTLCVTDLMLMDRLLDNLPYAKRDLREYFESITPLSSRWDELEFQTMIAITLNDERSKELVSLYEEQCDWRTPVYQGLLSLQKGQLRQARHHFSMWTNTRYGGSEYSAFNNLAVLTALIGKGKRREVLRIIDQAIEMNPDIPNLWTNKGMFLVDFWQASNDDSFLKEAVKAFNRALSIDPENIQAHLGMGTIHFEKEDAADALEHFEQVLPHLADDIEVLTIVGMILQKMYNQEEESNVLNRYCEILKRIARVNPEYPGIWYTLGESFQLIGNVRGARGAYLKAIEYENNREIRAKLYSNIGVSYSKEGNLEKAEDLLRRAEAEDPESSEIKYNLGRVLHEQERHPKALDYYLGSLRKREDYSKCLYNLGVLLETLEMTDRAKKAFHNCRDSDESHFEARVKLGALLISTREFEEAETVLLEAILLRPDDGQAWKQLGRLMDEANQSIIDSQYLQGGAMDREEVRSHASMDADDESPSLADFEVFSFEEKQLLLKPP